MAHCKEQLNSPITTGSDLAVQGLDFQETPFFRSFGEMTLFLFRNGLFGWMYHRSIFYDGALYSVLFMYILSLSYCHASHSLIESSHINIKSSLLWIGVLLRQTYFNIMRLIDVRC